MTFSGSASASINRGDNAMDRTRFVVLGSGPAGTAAASHVAKLGGDVTLVEREIVVGAARLWD